jgi:hypothetical protein
MVVMIGVLSPRRTDLPRHAGPQERRQNTARLLRQSSCVTCLSICATVRQPAADGQPGLREPDGLAKKLQAGCSDARTSRRACALWKSKTTDSYPTMDVRIIEAMQFQTGWVVGVEPVREDHNNDGLFNATNVEAVLRTAALPRCASTRCSFHQASGDHELQRTAPHAGWGLQHGAQRIAGSSSTEWVRDNVGDGSTGTADGGFSIKPQEG